MQKIAVSLLAKEKSMSRVLIIGDTHLPFVHKNYLKFVKSVYRKYKCNKVSQGGGV